MLKNCFENVPFVFANNRKIIKNLKCIVPIVMNNFMSDPVFYRISFLQS